MAGILVLGGCKSGKSSFAQCSAEKTGEKRLYVATGQATDEEMKDKIKKHREERGAGWETSEVEFCLSDVIRRKNENYDVILIDCITAWVTNLLIADRSFEAILDMVRDLEESIEYTTCPVIMVSNEVGYGIVPMNSLARRFRDIAGLVNQRIAEFSDEVILTVAGIPTKTK